MEITEQTPATPAPKKKRKKARKTPRRASFHKPTASARPAAPPSELAGLSASECPFDCHAEKCVISGRALCSHPYKGGLQSAMQNDPEAMRRYNQARKILAHAKVEQKG